MKKLLVLILIMFLSFTAFGGKFGLGVALSPFQFRLNEDWSAGINPICFGITYEVVNKFPLGLYIQPIIRKVSDENESSFAALLHIPLFYKFGMACGAELWNGEKQGGLVFPFRKDREFISLTYRIWENN
ncbi:MAG: hypothetical protein OEM46_00700 [Ignavibacteria bacterium]|nr:hypothetical protein [Ignavibacteria bacterium]